ncbi:MAG: hypothetical protein KAY65_02980 [Planctomycetes bacterium]|nr:hypothetical protein [Planctomycetota bacterium]
MRRIWIFPVAVILSLLPAHPIGCVAASSAAWGWPVADPARTNQTTSSSARAGSTILEARVFPIEGQTQGLEPQILDFHYAPKRWQVCIGLPDDPHKSMVGCDGGLYYDYGAGSFYDFGTRIRTGLETQGQKSDIAQSLYNPRIPIVVTKQNIGPLTLEQCAWAAAPREKHISNWAPRRVDYLWLRMANNSDAPQTGCISVQINSRTPLAISDDNTRLLERGNPDRTFCILSPACAKFDPQALARDYLPGKGIEAADPPAVNKGWAYPNIACDRRFRDIMVRYAGPLTFTYHAKPGKKYRVAFGLIESWHAKPGVRPLEIRIEGKTVRSLDLIKEFGRNTPVVLIFDAEDTNGDGLIEMGIHSPKHAEDNNTILSLLWAFDSENAPTEKQLIAGGQDDRALAVTYPGKAQRTIKLLFEQKRLAPDEEYLALLTFYRGNLASARTTQDQADHELDRAIEYWGRVDLPYDRITVPDPAIQGLLDSCIRNIYQARELRNGQPAFQVGPTCYRGTWAADGPFILESITYLGRAKEARAGLELQIDKDEGPQGVKFSKKSGLRLWMIWRHAQLTGDFKWLEKTWPKVEQNVKNIIEYRKMTRDDPTQANYGLMPPGFGDGGLGGVHREYTNVYWTLAGLKAAIEMAQKLNKPTLANWQAEYKDYWQTFDNARNRDKLTDKAGNVYVPVTMKGEQAQPPQRGAWAFLQSVFPGRIFDPDDKLMLGNMAMLDANQAEGLIFGTGWMHDGIWNYAASFYAHAHLYLGHSKKAAATLYAFANHACPLLCWREEQNPKGQNENYVGDMPHNWASAEFIRLIRHLLILERGNELHLLGALPTAWTKPGSKTQLLDIPTSFGPASLILQMAPNAESARIQITPPRRQPPKKIAVHLEHFQKPIKQTRTELKGSNFIITVTFK